MEIEELVQVRDGVLAEVKTLIEPLRDRLLEINNRGDEPLTETLATITTLALDALRIATVLVAVILEEPDPLTPNFPKLSLVRDMPPDE